MENTKHHRLTSFAETASEAPLQEPDRQYYFIEKAKDIFAEKCKEADKTLTFCVTTFGCQMNAVSENYKSQSSLRKSVALIYGLS